MEEALTSYLLAGTSLVTLIGQSLTWNVRQQGGPSPAIVLHNISSIPTYTDEGDANLTSTRIQSDTWASTWQAAKDASRELTNRMTAGGLGKFTHGGFEFQVSFKEDEQESFEREVAALDLYRVRIDFNLLYKQQGV